MAVDIQQLNFIPCQMYKVNTSILEDIAEATQLVCGYIKHMPRGMGPLLGEVEFLWS